MKRIPGNRTMAGAHGTLYIDGERLLELTAFDAKVVAERAEVQHCGSLDKDSKITSLGGEGNMTIDKVYSRGANVIKSWNRGEDKRLQLMGVLDDPDAYGSERVIINNVWLDEAILMVFTAGEDITEETPFGFTPSDVEFPDLVEPR